MSEQEFADAVRELGGNEEDLRMLADADFSGSDWEDSNNTASGKTISQQDVAKMWSQLSGEKLDETAAVNTSDLKDTFKEEKEPKKERQAKREPKKDEPKDDPKKNKDPRAKEASKETSKFRSITPDLKNAVTQQTAVKKPQKPAQMSKKDMLAWEQYTNSLTHPDEMLIEDQQWFELADANASARAVLTPDIVDGVYQKSQQLLTVENQMYFKRRQNDREFTSSLDFLKSGTYSDQLGTLSILSTESPLHSIRFLENLASKCEIKNRESACKALEVTKDLLVSQVLPDRRLRWFKDQPLHLSVEMPQLVSWAFEDFLKRLFFRLLQSMERLLADTVENIRMRTLHCVFDFFTAKPEQEANLLRLGLNKLGDPAGKVASRVKRLLMDALQQHPGMKPVVAAAMDETLGRTTDYRTRYYAVDTLSEFILSNRDPALANRLIYIYLELFERLLNESKLQRDGGRPEPAVAANKKPVKGSKRFRQKRGKRGGLQQHQNDASETENQQHARLVAKLFTGLNRAFPFSNLDPAMFAKYTDTMYQMSHSPNVGTFIEALSFIFQLSKTVTSATASKNSSAAAEETGPSSMNRYYRALYDSLLDTRLPYSAKLGKYVHLLLKSMAELKPDSEIARSSAFVKRMLQVSCNLAEVGAAASFIHVASLTPHYQRLLNYTGPSSETGENATGSGDRERDREVNADSQHQYDPKQRDPRFAKAETSQAWETLLLQQHYHPTIALYAQNLLADPNAKQSLEMPDIDQYSVNQFLSKWAYKKPKVKESTRGGSIFQPLAGFTDLDLGVRFMKRDVDDVPASMQDWKSKNIKDVAPEDRFMYDYFVQRPDRKPKNKASKQEDGQKDENADGDEESDLAEDEINEAMSRSGPGDYDNTEINMSDMSDDSADGDLDDQLADAFNDEDDESDAGDDSGGESDNDKEAAQFDPTEFDGDLNGVNFDNDSGEDELDVVGEDDDFTQFNNETVNNNEDKGDKKRKRAWTQYPTFLDADAFDEMQVEKKSAKRRN